MLEEESVGCIPGSSSLCSWGKSRSCNELKKVSKKRLEGLGTFSLLDASKSVCSIVE